LVLVKDDFLGHQCGHVVPFERRLTYASVTYATVTCKERGKLVQGELFQQ
jgi:hypothetical protein